MCLKLKNLLSHHRKTLNACLFVCFFNFGLCTLKAIRSRFHIAYHYCIINSNIIKRKIILYPFSL